MRWLLPLLVCVQVVSAQPLSLPDQFGSGSNAFAIDFVVVGDVGNAPHSSGVGSVGYDYRIGKYEVSENLITKAEAQGMTSVPREFGFGDQPIDISWANAAKFVNFLNTSKGYPAAYNVVEGQLPTRNPNAYYYIPSDNEWVKAAHYKGSGTNAGYWRYAIGSDATPQPTNSSVLPNTVVYWGQFSQSYPSTSVYTAGGLSPYGTMGQNGNFSEYTDTLFAINQRRTRGGAFSATIDSSSDGLHLTNVSSGGSIYIWFWELGRKGASTGFRVASVHDTSKPVLTLNGSDMTVFRGVPFVDPSVTFTDNYDPPRPIKTDGVVDTMAVGTYTLTYSAKDNAGNEARPVTRTIEVVLDPNGDEDNDGLNNTEEASLGTSPYLRDTDGDGVNDLREVGDGSDPLDPASFDSLSLGLVAYYPFNGNANDESGNEIHGTSVNSVLDADRYGQTDAARRFSPSWRSRVEIPWQTNLVTNVTCFSFWFKTAELDPRAPFVISGTAEYDFSFHLNSAARYDGLRFIPSPFVVVDSTEGYKAGVWNHVVAVSGSDSQEQGIWLNGRKISTYVSGGDPAAPSQHVSDRLWIGGRQYESSRSGTYFDGWIDDVRIYNRALSSQEVASLYGNEKYAGFGLEGAATKSPFDPATAANWNAGGTAWTVDTTVTHDGVDSVKAQTTDGQSTYREYTVTGPAVVDFWWKVSSEKNYDKFSYSLNGVNQETISGEVDWAYRTLTLPAGSHTIRWTYSKDESGAVGQDAGWLDDFVVYPATATLQMRDGSTVLGGTATVDFGSAETESMGFSKSLTFANEGYVPLEVQLALPEGSPFTFEDGSAVYGLLLGRDESLDVPIVLSTQGAGTRSAQLTVLAPDSTIAPPAITLTGYVRGPDIGVAQGGSSLTSGQTFDMGLTPQTVEFTIRNNGNTADLVISAVSATGNFQIAQQPATTISPQGSTTFKVLAQNVASGLQSGSVSIASNAGNLAIFSLPLTSKSLTSVTEGIADGSMATSGTGGATAWDFGATTLPSGQNGQALKTGSTPNNGGSVLEFTAQTAGVVSWSWKVSTQEDFDWLLCEVDGQEVAGISTKSGVWQTQVVNVPAGANIRWVYRKDGSGNIGEDAGYLANVEFRNFTANQSFEQWGQTHGFSGPRTRMPKSGMQAMFGWLGGFGIEGENTDDHHKAWILSGRLTYRYPISKTADGTQQILYSPDMSAWTTRRFSQRVVSEDANRIVIEATAPSGTKGFFKIATNAAVSMVEVTGGILPQSSIFADYGVADFLIADTEVTWAEWQEVRTWAVANGYDLAGVGQGSGPNHPVRNVNWFDALKWCNAKSEKEGLTPAYFGRASYPMASSPIYRTGQTIPQVNPSANGYRLPTDREWEWAALGGLMSQGFTFSGSNNPDTVAWSWENSVGASLDLYLGRGTWPVAQKGANELGLFDMSGNIYEWCYGPNLGFYATVRGGFFASAGADCTSAAFYPWGTPYSREVSVGFRVARSAED